MKYEIRLKILLEDSNTDVKIIHSNKYVKAKKNLREMELGQMFMMMDCGQKKHNFIQSYLSIQLRKLIKHIILKKIFMSTNILLKAKMNIRFITIKLSDSDSDFDHKNNLSIQLEIKLLTLF